MRWVPDVAAVALGPDVLALPHPGSAARVARWEAVLAQRVPAVAPVAAGRRHVVATLGADGYPLAAALAAVLGREPVTTDDPPALLRSSASVLLVAGPAALGYRALAAWTAAAAERRTPFGLVTGRDPAAAAFLAAKLVTRPAREPERMATVDVLAGVVAAPAPERLTAAALAAALAGPLRHLVVLGHADGGHLKLATAGAGVCGCVDTGYARCDGRGGCVRSGPGRRTVLLARDLAAERITVAGCNGFAVDGARVPAELSLALAAAEGRAAAYVAAAGQLIADVGAGSVAVVAGGSPTAGEYAARLRDVLRAPSPAPVVVLLGDPLARWGAAAPPPSVRRSPPPVVGVPVPPLTAGDRAAAAAAVRDRLAGPLGGAFSPAEAAAVRAALAVDDDGARDADVRFAGALATALRRLGESLLHIELAHPVRVGSPCACGETVDVLAGVAHELDVCPLCGPVLLRAPADTVRARPVGNWVADGTAALRLERGRGALALPERPARVVASVDGARSDTGVWWDMAAGPLELPIDVPGGLPPDTYYVRYVVVRGLAFAVGRCRVTVR